MLNQQTTSLMRAIDAFNEAIMLVDTGEASWTIMFINDAWLRMMGAPHTPKLRLPAKQKDFDGSNGICFADRDLAGSQRISGTLPDHWWLPSPNLHTAKQLSSV